MHPWSELPPVPPYGALLPVDHSYIHEEVIQGRQKGDGQQNPKGMGSVAEESSEYEHFPSQVEKGRYPYINSQEEEKPQDRKRGGQAAAVRREQPPMADEVVPVG